jgi:hypothetical protein
MRDDLNRAGRVLARHGHTPAQLLQDLCSDLKKGSGNFVLLMLRAIIHVCSVWWCYAVQPKSSHEKKLFLRVGAVMALLLGAALFSPLSASMAVSPF